MGVSPAGVTEFLVFPPEDPPFELIATTTGSLRFPTTRSGQVAAHDVGTFNRAPLSGVVYEDHNGNGQRDAEDQPFTRFPVVVAPDTNGDGLYGTIGDCAQFNYCTPDGYEPTNQLGEYRTVGPGNFSVSIPDDPNGNSILTVTDGRAGVLTRSGEEIENANFGVFEHVFASGQVFEDRDNSGELDSHDDRLLKDVTVGLDLDDDGTVDETVMTDDLGVCTFPNIPPGTHRVRPLLKPGAVQILPADPGGILMPILITPRSGEPIDLPLIGVNLGNDIAVTAATRAAATRVTFDFTTDGRPEPFQAGLYQSANETFDADPRVDVRVGSLIQITPAPGGGAQQGSFPLPRNFQRDPQRPRLIVVADPNRRVAEVDEANNTTVVETTADIAITSAKRENNGTFPGSPQIVTVRYGLAGNPGPFDLALYRSADNRFGPGDLPLDGTVRRITPPPGATSGGEIFNIGQYRPDPALPFLVVAADRDNLVDEIDETNNAARVERVIDLAPIQVEGNFNYNEPQDRFEALGGVQIGLKPGGSDPFVPLMSLTSGASYDVNTIRASGLATTKILGDEVNLFAGTISIDIRTATASGLALTGNGFTLADLPFLLTSLALVNPGGGSALDSVLELQGRLTLPLVTSIVGFPDQQVTIAIEGSHRIQLGSNGVTVTGGRVEFPNTEFQFFGVDFSAEDLAIEYFGSQEAVEIPDQNSFRIQGKLTMKNFARSQQVTADLTGENFLRIKGNKADLIGSITAENFKIGENFIVIKSIKLSADTTRGDFRIEGDVQIIPITGDRSVLFGAGLLNGSLNFLSSASMA